MADKDDKLKEVNYSINEKENSYYTDTYAPGETKEQLRIGHEVKGDVGSKFWIQEYEHTAGVGSFSFTGAWFKPKAVKFFTMYPWNGQTATFGFGFGTALQQRGYDLYESGSAIIGTVRNGSSAIASYNAVQNNHKVATITSFDDDGVTLNFTTSVGSMFIVVEYYW